jgi:uncharacterized caspase-like protein
MKRLGKIQWTVMALALLILVAPVSVFANEQRVALVIGNGAYKDSPLKNPVNDATDISAVLKELDFKVITRTDATLRQMKAAVDAFWVELKQGGVGLFFFAGHGLQVQGRNYLVPVDAGVAVEQDVEFECLDAGRVLGRMEAAGNDLNLVFLDACRNNPFARSFRSGRRGLARMDAPTGSLVAFATAPGSVAADGKGRNGIFTGALLKHIRTPGLQINELLMSVRRDVVERSSKKQVPWESSSLLGKFYFASSGAITIPEASNAIANLEGERQKLEQERREFERLKAEVEERTRIEAERKRAQAEKKVYASIGPSVKELNKIERYGNFIKQDNGIVYDERTNQEWYAGPDEDTTWIEADKWAKRLTVSGDGWRLFGGGWRLPTYEELRSLYVKEAGTNNIIPLLQTSGSRLWTNEKKTSMRDSYWGPVDTSLARAFVFKGGYDYWEAIVRPNGYRAFAVRTRK